MLPDKEEGYFLVYYYEKQIEWHTPALKMKREEVLEFFGKIGSIII